MPQISELAAKLDALGHPIRLRIIATLAKRNQEMYLNEIANAIGISRALAKIHLKKLEKAGLAKTRIALSEGEAKALRYYELCPFDIHVTPQILKKEVENLG
ncbi:MAG: helix-turn-helix domain-containing protein [Candidatus Bathyarchaeota archaeon]|nr:helix-turn-helix domain-containing protein [Candidatus Bathyarchaeota archaeon]